MRLIQITSLLFFLTILSCSPSKEKADLIIHNAVVYTIDSSFTVTQAIAIKDGKILSTGSNEEILNAYDTKEKLDAEGKSVFPGFIDAHCHFLSYGLGLRQVDLVGTNSFAEVISRVQEFAQASGTKGGWIIGRGWDQNDWEIKEYPTKEKLDSLFPGTPVLLKRIDGHAALVNNKALQLANINEKTKIDGGELLFIPDSKKSQSAKESISNSRLSGVLIDNAVDLVTSVIPRPDENKLKEALLAAQKDCFAVGLTTVDDAGLMKYEIDAIDKFQKSAELKMRVYAMLSDSAPNYEYYLKNGPYKTGKLNVCSFKFYGDGALGSRGACLWADYSDKPGWRGFLLKSWNYYHEKAQVMNEKQFQMNVHCIGDSCGAIILRVFGSTPVLYSTPLGYFEKLTKARRWRIEHAQVVLPNDFKLFSEFNVIPSVQPTHATSDMYWAEKRLGKERVKYAYAYKDLLKAAGILALGTDFPVEDISPFKTFYAAVARKDSKGYPEGGFQMENALTREETIKGMTTWAAYANFEEKEKGSIEKGKFADLVLLDTDIMKCAIEEVLKTKVIATFVNGEKVYDQSNQR